MRDSSNCRCWLQGQSRALNKLGAPSDTCNNQFQALGRAGTSRTTGAIAVIAFLLLRYHLTLP